MEYVETISRYIPPRWGRCHGAWCNRRGRRHRQARGSGRVSFEYLSPRKVWPRSDVAPASCTSPADIETKEDDDQTWGREGRMVRHLPSYGWSMTLSLLLSIAAIISLTLTRSTSSKRIVDISYAMPSSGSYAIGR